MYVNKAEPSDARQLYADDDLKLSEADGYYDLVRAMIARAYQDSVGNTGASGNLTLEARQRWTMDAIAFFKDNRCKHWCQLLGIADYELLGLGRR